MRGADDMISNACLCQVVVVGFVRAVNLATALGMVAVRVARCPVWAIGGVAGDPSQQWYERAWAVAPGGRSKAGVCSLCCGMAVT